MEKNLTKDVTSMDIGVNTVTTVKVHFKFNPLGHSGRWYRYCNASVCLFVNVHNLKLAFVLCITVSDLKDDLHCR